MEHLNYPQCHDSRMRISVQEQDKMASAAKSLEDMLSSDVDESAVSALVGSLESQLSSTTTHGAVSDTNSSTIINNNHVNNALMSDGSSNSVPAPQKLASTNVSNLNQTIGANLSSSVIQNSDVALKQANSTVLMTNATRPAVLSSTVPGATPTGVISSNQAVVAAQSTTGSSNVQIKNIASNNGGVNGNNLSTSNHPHTFSSSQIQVLPNGNATNIPINAQKCADINMSTTAIQSNVELANSTTIQTQSSGTVNTLSSSTVHNSSLVTSSSSDSTVHVNASVLQTNAAANVLKSANVPPNAAPILTAAKQSVPGTNVVTQVVSTPGNVLQGVQIVNVNANNLRTGSSSVAIPVNACNTISTAISGSTQPKTLAPRVVIGNPMRIATGQQLIAARPSAPNALQNTITLPSGLMRGTLLVKTENGQYQLVNVASALTPSSNASSIPGTAAYRLQPTSQGQTRGHAPQQLAVTLPVSATNGQVKVHQTNASSASMPQNISNHAGSDQLSMSSVRLHGTPNSQISARPQTFQNIASPIHHRPIHPSMSTRNIIVNRQPVVYSNANIGQPLSVQTTIASPASGPVPSSQMSPDTAKKKCTNFLSTLIRLAGDQPEQVARNVKDLIQGLIDGIVNPEDFTVQLQKELHSSPQPCLVPFLKKSLPYLRHSLATKELSIQGVRPPPPGTVITLPSAPHSIPTIQLTQSRPQVSTTQQIKILSTAVPSVTRATQGLSPRPLNAPRIQSVKAVGANKIISNISTVSPASMNALQTRPIKAVVATTGKEKPEKRAFSALRDDDDINDVAAMGGVNLVEESAKILAVNSDLVGTQIRSCKDENFLFTSPLHHRIKDLTSKFGLEDPSSEVISLISHAAQERLKSLVEKLGVIAEHRMENVKTDPKYEVSNNTRSQVKFLEELDKLERKRHEEEEREILLRAAKSRSKVEDPEQQKLKLKAKEMQRLELEEMRQREANTTALLAIGPRKKFKPDQSTSSSNSTTNNSSGTSTVSSRPVIRQRVKRVNMKDLLFLLEQEKETCKSNLLYKAFFK